MFFPCVGLVEQKISYFTKSGGFGSGSTASHAIEYS